MVARQGRRCRDRSLRRGAILANGRARATNRQRRPIAREASRLRPQRTDASRKRSGSAGGPSAEARAGRIPVTAGICIRRRVRAVVTMGEPRSPSFDLKRRVSFAEKRVENSIRTKRRKFAEDFVAPAIVPNPARLPVGEELPRDGHLAVGRWTCVRCNVGKSVLNFGERESFEGARAVRGDLRGGFDLHDEKRPRLRRLHLETSACCALAADVPAHRAKSSEGARGGADGLPSRRRGSAPSRRERSDLDRLVS